MFHCHNLIHEDHEMMAAFNVTALTDLGYDEKTSFIDPMEARYRSKSFPDGDLSGRSGDFSDDAILAKMNWFVALEAYKNVGKVENALENYWKTKSASTLSTAVRSSTVAQAAGATAAAASSSPAAAAASSSAASSPAAAAAASGSSSDAAAVPTTSAAAAAASA